MMCRSIRQMQRLLFGTATGIDPGVICTFAVFHDEIFLGLGGRAPAF